MERTQHQPVECLKSGARIGLVARALILLVQLYQGSLSPIMGGHCRFHPTCSSYSIDALRTHGPWRGTWLTIRRIVRCHPLGGCGYDPIPPARDQ